MEAIAIIWAQRVYKALISIERRDLYIVLFSRHRLTIALLGEIKQELQRFQKCNINSYTKIWTLKLCLLE